MANPTGLIHAAVMMLVHLGQSEVANTIRNALYKTIEDGLHTPDVYNAATSKKKVGTKEFTKAVVANLGQKPSQLKVANFANATKKTAISAAESAYMPEEKSLIGFDLFIDWQAEFSELLSVLKTMESDVLEVKMISAKGLLMWPLSDQHMMPNYIKGLTVLRFIGKGITGKSSNEIIDSSKTISQQNIIEMLGVLNEKKFDFVKYEGLYLFNGKCGYTSGQGE